MSNNQSPNNYPYDSPPQKANNQNTYQYPQYPPQNQSINDNTNQLQPGQHIIHDEDYIEDHLKVGFGNNRKSFIQKVFGIVGAQLFLTFIICYFSTMDKGFQMFQLNHPGVLLTACLLTFIILFPVLCCFPKTLREVPLNYFIVFFWTLCQGYVVGYYCAQANKPQIVMEAGILTIAMCVAIIVYAFTTKEDFTTSGGMLYVLLMCFMISGIFMCFTHNQTVDIIYCTLGVILFGFYLLYDVQLLMEQQAFSYSIDDYMIAALNIYLDVINIFIDILRILGRN